MHSDRACGHSCTDYLIYRHTVANVFLLLLLDSLQVIFRSSLDGRALYRLPYKPYSGFPVKIRSAIVTLLHALSLCINGSPYLDVVFS